MKKIYLLIVIIGLGYNSLMAGGTCGANLTWNLTDGVLAINGTGDMTDWVTFASVPWYSNRVNISSVTIGNSVTSIGEYAFYDCSSLTSVTIGNSVTSIGENAFERCRSLASIEIPNSVTRIGNNAFFYCTGLITIEIPNSVTSMGIVAFRGCTALTSVTIGSTNIGDNAFSECSNLTSVTIGNNVTSIGHYAFNECNSLTSIEIPDNVTSIGGGIFSDCSALSNIVVENSNSVYDSRNNCNAIIETASNMLIAGCQSTIIPNSVTYIGSSAFYKCNSLTSIEIPNSITNIGNSAFKSCGSLTTVYCEALEPPLLGYSPFDYIPNTAILYVPIESVEAYSTISGYADSFAEIRGMIFGESEVDSITSTTATLKWLPDSAVVQYDINVYTADTLFAHYVVDGNGQIISSQRFAPSIYHQKMDTTVSSTEYFVISLVGLSAGTSYSYTIDGINAHNAPIYHEEGSFKTMDEGEEGLFDVILDDPRRQAIKIFRDGQIYILRGEKVYIVTGQEVK